ncbi:MAG: FecR family protein [Balneolaceae bacterium]
MTNRKLPHNDPDLQLSKMIGRYLEGEREWASEEDTVMRDLLLYKKIRTEIEKDVIFPAEKVWHGIEAQISKRSQKTFIHDLNSSNRWAWALAAAILLAAVLSVFYIIMPQPPELVAETGQAVRVVKLADGSEVTLRPHSKLYIISDSEPASEYQLKGEGYFNVQSNSDREFKVNAGNGRVVVIGTKFILSDWGNRTRVFLEEGLVRLEVHESEEKIELLPGQKVLIDEDKNVSVPEQADIIEFKSWLDNQLILAGRPARDVFDELEHHFNIKISAPENIEMETLGGSIALEDKNQSLDDLGRVLGGSFATDDDISYNFVTNS